MVKKERKNNAYIATNDYTGENHNHVTITITIMLIYHFHNLQIQDVGSP